jgi:hypothetical protein
MRLEAGDYLRWAHTKPLEQDGNIIFTILLYN